MKLLILLFLITPVLGFSQCEDSDKLEFGGTYLSKSRNRIPFDLDRSDTVKYCCDVKKIKAYADWIVSKARDFIISRASEDFYRKLEIHQIDVNYPDSIKVKYENQSLYDLSKFNISYWIIYTYSNENIRYGFGLEFNRNGEMISENKFPDFSKNKTAEHFTDVCQSLEVVRSDERFAGKEVELVELAYLDEVNSFCWLVEEKMGPMECGKHEFALDRFYVNANTNKIAMVKERRGIVYVCCAEILRHR